MVKIMTFCNGVTDPNRAFELDRRGIRLLAPSKRGEGGKVLGLYAFRYIEGDDEHIRTAGKKIIEALVLCGVVPSCVEPVEIPEPENPLASAMLNIGHIELDDIMHTLEVDSGEATNTVIYL